MRPSPHAVSFCHARFSDEKRDCEACLAPGPVLLVFCTSWCFFVVCLLFNFDDTSLYNMKVNALCFTPSVSSERGELVSDEIKTLLLFIVTG